MNEAEKIAEKAGAKPGDRISITVEGVERTGLLMPRIDAGSREAVIVKLDNGYNVGFDAKKITAMKRIGEGTALEKKQELATRFDPTKPPVAMIATGGTISTRVDYRTGGVFMTLKPEEILATAPRLAEIARISAIDSPFRVASEDMTPKEWQTLAEITAKRLNEGAQGAIVTHGTDILHYTAAALSFMLTGLSKPVALVGAQRSPDRASFDGTMNLMCAARYATSDIGELAVVMHGTNSDDYCLAHRGTKVRKMHSTRRDAFKTINDEPLAKLWEDGRIEKLAESRKREDAKVVADTRFERKIALVKTYPGADPEILDHYVERKCRGLIIEAYALGHVPTETIDAKDSWIPHVKAATDAGLLVGVTSQCINGPVNPFVYRNLRLLAAAGAVHLNDMLTETAYVKLGCALGRFKSTDKARAFMLENVAGEYNPRLTE